MLQAFQSRTATFISSNEWIRIPFSSRRPSLMQTLISQAARLPSLFYNKLIRFYHRNMKRASVDRPLYVIPIWNLFWIWRGGSNRYATIIQGASVMVFSIRNLGHLLLLDAAYRSLILRWQIIYICGLSALSVLLSWVV